MARFELATSWSQTRRDNRATLHPELLVIDLKKIISFKSNHNTSVMAWKDSNLQPSRSLSGRDNRATLHPELLVIDLKKLLCGEGGIRTHGTV